MMARFPSNISPLAVSREIAVNPACIGDIRDLQLQNREVILTFDDGPAPPTTEIILDVLNAEQVKATFFLIGCRASRFPELVRRAASEGHTIGTHTQFHQCIPALSADEQRQEIDQGIKSTEIAFGTSGRSAAPFFRFPYLQGTPAMEAYLASRGIMAWGADVNPDDWMNFSVDQVVANALAVLAKAGKGVMLLHDPEPKTALALPRLLRQLKSLDYRIVHATAH
jgi:peptidoglycan-N-acetylglucosamine deacetylase